MNKIVLISQIENLSKTHFKHKKAQSFDHKDFSEGKVDLGTKTATISPLFRPRAPALVQICLNMPCHSQTWKILEPSLWKQDTFSGWVLSEWLKAFLYNIFSSIIIVTFWGWTLRKFNEIQISEWSKCQTFCQGKCL